MLQLLICNGKVGENMEVKTGYIYHIKNEYFDKVNDSKLMSNYENKGQRPTYFTIKDNDILWFIPLSSKVEKYKNIVDNKIKKYGICRTILIREVMNKSHAILLQNAFPIIEKYIDHPHLINGKPIKVIPALKEEILENFKFLLSMKNKGNNLFFADIDRLKNIMLEELKELEPVI